MLSIGYLRNGYWFETLKHTNHANKHIMPSSMNEQQNTKLTDMNKITFAV